MNLIIRNERIEEYDEVEKMTREAFWNVYKPGCDEHLMLHQLRQSKEFVKELDFVAECDGKIVGNIICSKCSVKNDDAHTENNEDVICIGPIGVLPEYQKKGIGAMLMKQAIDHARQMQFKGIVLYGNPEFYHKFGFVNAKHYDLSTPQNTNFEEFMALELTPGSLQTISGRCYESKAFEIQPDELEAFEQRFQS